MNLDGIGFFDVGKMKDAMSAQIEADPTNATRPYRMYIYNAPTMIKTMSGSVFDSRKKYKVRFIYKDNREILWDHINKDQVEKNMGGNVEDLTENFWPPKCPNTNFKVENCDSEQQFITKEQYAEKFDKGELEGYKVCHEIIDEVKNRKEIKEDSIEISVNDP